MRELPYYAQPQGVRSCGAACLCMVYEYFGIKCDQDEIFSKVSKQWGTEKSCRCYLMVQNALSKGLAAYCISCQSLKNDIPKIMDAGFEVITLAHRQKRNNNAAHFCLAVSVSENGWHLYLNDPELGEPKGKNKKVRFDDISERAKRQYDNDELGIDNTLIIISKSIDGQEVISINLGGQRKTFLPKSIAESVKMILDPEDDRFYSISN